MNFPIFRVIEGDALNVAIFVHEFRMYSGVSEVVEQQSNEFSEDGDSVTIYTLASNRTPRYANLVIMGGAPKNKILRHIFKLFYPFFIGIHYKHIYAMKDFDILIVHLYSLTWIGYISKKIYPNIIYVYHDHGIADLNSVPLVEKVFLIIMSYYTNTSISNADYIISISKFMRDSLPEKYKKKSIVIYNKINPERFSKETNYSFLKEKYDLSDGAPLFLYVGRLSENKGIVELIRSFKELITKLPNSKLLLVGRPYQSFNLKSFLNSISACKNIIWTGQASEEELVSLYHLCDVYVSASKWESFGMPVVEAQMLGKPVVVYNVGAHSEIVKNNETGIIVEPFNEIEFSKAMIRVYNHKEEMGNNAKKWAYQFSTTCKEGFRFANFIKDIKQ